MLIYTHNLVNLLLLKNAEYDILFDVLRDALVADVSKDSLASSIELDEFNFWLLPFFFGSTDCGSSEKQPLLEVAIPKNILF